ncbi:GNAT family N-acetyltransferase [Cognatiluteimonas weifangensis]|uniref:GNAT family N-acetyltransferase n=1 Tax=Cognatiluteimonas weifangensis TaxID=2303539 RepID=A0A372DII4_9GAMM|nr:GNAT family N-acetyltransferase [Luteimonas weifangensis]RFP59346.1 GNAT family N-acetyltransferase [Luteimonas weifangensis]
MDTSIRRAGPRDLDALAALFDAYRRFYGQPADLARARDWLRARMRFGESVVLIAERDGATAGFVQLYPMYSSVRTARTWILNDLFVADAARRRGVARALLDAAVQYAREDGAAGISLETTRDNAAARALYRAAGWHEDATQWYSLALD